MQTDTLRRLALLALAAGCTVLAPGYDLIRSGQTLVKWPAGTIPMQIKLGTSTNLQDGTSYNSTFQAALNEWNAVLRDVQFTGTVGTTGVGGDNNSLNEAFFDGTVYGDAFQGATVAVTVSYRSAALQPDGTYRRTQSDIVFKNTETWDSYRGATQGRTLDLRRVALHELGHVLGLDHPDEAGQAVSAIMNSHVSSTYQLQRDDLDGAQRLYGVPGVSVAPANDLFSNATAISLTGTNAITLTGSSVGAGKESGEPNHASGETGGASVWWKWTAASNGTLTVSTDGSNFDTLLAAYTGSAVGSLTQLASNDDIEPPPATGEDITSRNRRSRVTIPVTSGTTYYFAVDGWQAEWGTINLGLSLSSVDPDVAPTISTHPQSQSVFVGANVVFTVVAAGKPNPTYQWSKGSVAIAGATGTTLSLPSVQTSDAGNYTVTVTNSLGSVTSNTATLTVSVATTPPPSGGGGGGGGGGAPSTWFLAALAFAGVARRLTRRH